MKRAGKEIEKQREYMQGEKQALRKKFLIERKRLSKKELEDRSFKVMHEAKGLIRNGDKVLMFYVPINNEVDLLPLAADLMETDRTILFPRMVKDRIVPYVVRDFYSDFKPGAFNIPEPDTKPYKGSIDIIYIPGVVFGKNGYRIGYGRGYYDAFLSSAKVRYCAGVGFDFQIANQVPFTERDHPMDAVVTEEEIIVFQKK